MKTFTITNDHLKLVRAMAPNLIWWSSEEDNTGSPAVNRITPYGSRDIISDVRRILDVELLEVRCLALHRETAVTLQIVISTGAFQTGVYEAEDNTCNWIKVAEPKTE